MDLVSEGVYQTVRKVGLKNIEQGIHEQLHSSEKNPISDDRSAIFAMQDNINIWRYLQELNDQKDRNSIRKYRFNAEQLPLKMVLLFAALQEKCVDCTKYLLENLGDTKEAANILIEKNIDGLTPLHIVAKNVDQECLDLLLPYLPHTAACIQLDSEGKIPVQHALLNGASNHMLDELHLKWYLYNVETKTGRNMVHFAILNCLSNTPDSKRLLEYIIKNNHQDSKTTSSLLNAKEYISGYTPLHIAILYNCLAAAEFLLDCHVNPDEQNLESNTPLHTAVYNDNLQAVQLLLKYNANVNLADDKKRTPLHTASCYNHLRIAESLFNARADVNALDCKARTPLHKSLRYNRLQVARLLLANQAIGLDVSDYKEFTLLHTAIMYHDDSHQNVRENLYLFQVLLANVKRQCFQVIYAADNAGYTAIHFAVHEGYYLILKEFLEIDSTLLEVINNKNGKNLLHTILERDIKNSLKIMNVLQDYPKETVNKLLKAQDNSKKTPIAILKEKIGQSLNQQASGNLEKLIQKINKYDTAELPIDYAMQRKEQLVQLAERVEEPIRSPSIK